MTRSWIMFTFMDRFFRSIAIGVVWISSGVGASESTDCRAARDFCSFRLHAKETGSERSVVRHCNAVLEFILKPFPSTGIL